MILLRRAMPALLALATLLLADRASAYPWMIRHGYAGCGTCHADPSGGSVLTAYGRTVGGMLLSTHWGGQPDEPDPYDGFLLGAVPLPPELMLGGDVRMLYLSSKLEGVEVRHHLFLMQADFEAAVDFHHLVAGASIGYSENDAYGAALTNGADKNLVSRVHYLGYELSQSDSLIVRAGRLNLPFGIRDITHTLWARSVTQTSINADQQHGVSFAWAPESFRGEFMAILGNFQINPDDYRERGYSGYFEWFPSPRLGLGASSLITHRDLDPTYLVETWRQTHGLFTRWATGWEPLVVLAEADYQLYSPKNDLKRKGTVAYVQADVEALRGVHFMLTGEMQHVGVHGTPFSWGAWLSELWFLAPHLDLRLDNIYQSLGDVGGRTDSLTLLAQAHLYL